MKNLDLTNKSVIITEPEINFITNTIKEFLSPVKLKIELLLKRLLTPKSLRIYSDPVYTQHQDPLANIAKSSNLNRGINNRNFSKFDECLNNMPPLQRKAFELKTFEKNSTALICKELNINEAVFWSLIHKSRKELIIALNIN